MHDLTMQHTVPAKETLAIALTLMLLPEPGADNLQTAHIGVQHHKGSNKGKSTAWVLAVALVAATDAADPVSPELQDRASCCRLLSVLNGQPALAAPCVEQGLKKGVCAELLGCDRWLPSWAVMYTDTYLVHCSQVE
jgi:hypothetical protein